jgi:hypothetical protein
VEAGVTVFSGSFGLGLQVEANMQVGVYVVSVCLGEGGGGGIAVHGWLAAGVTGWVDGVGQGCGLTLQADDLYYDSGIPQVGVYAVRVRHVCLGGGGGGVYAVRVRHVLVTFCSCCCCDCWTWTCAAHVTAA